MKKPVSYTYEEIKKRNFDTYYKMCPLQDYKFVENCTKCDLYYEDWGYSSGCSVYKQKLKEEVEKRLAIEKAENRYKKKH